MEDLFPPRSSSSRRKASHLWQPDLCRFPDAHRDISAVWILLPWQPDFHLRYLPGIQDHTVRSDPWSLCGRHMHLPAFLRRWFFHRWQDPGECQNTLRLRQRQDGILWLPHQRSADNCAHRKAHEAALRSLASEGPHPCLLLLLPRSLLPHFPLPVWEALPRWPHHCRLQSWYPVCSPWEHRRCPEYRLPWHRNRHLPEGSHCVRGSSLQIWWSCLFRWNLLPHGWHS